MRAAALEREAINYLVVFGVIAFTYGQQDECHTPTTIQGLARASLYILKGHFLTPSDANTIFSEDSPWALTTPRRCQPVLSPDLDVISEVGFNVHFMVVNVNDGTRALRASHRW